MGNQLENTPVEYTSDQDQLESNKPSSRFSFDVHSMIRIKMYPIENQYMIFRPPIGQGAYGEVYQAKHKFTMIMRSVKKINKTDSPNFLTQFQALKQLDHPNILKLYEVFASESSCYLVTDYYQGGTLTQKIQKSRRLCEFSAAKYMEQILMGVSYMHNKGFMHCDLKPDNILFEGTHQIVKIIDYGMCRKITETNCESNSIGTLEYIAPEIRQGKIVPASDIWACGATLLMMISGCFPSYFRLNTGNFEIDCDFQCLLSREVKDLIAKMINPNHWQRITAEDALKHDWFKVQREKRKINIGQISRSLCYIKQYLKFNRLQSFFISLITNYYLSITDKLNSITSFMQCDKENKGVITVKQLKKIIEKIIPQSQKCKCLQNCLNQLIKYKPQRIDIHQFLTCSIDPFVVLQNKYLNQVYSSIGIGGQEQISIADMKKYVDLISPENQILHEQFQGLDINKDGFISINQFIEGMRQNIQ